jgi:hypothetical protein
MLPSVRGVIVRGDPRGADSEIVPFHSLVHSAFARDADFLKQARRSGATDVAVSAPRIEFIQYTISDNT